MASNIPKTMTFHEMLANYVLGNINCAGLIDLAQQALAQGYNSKHLRILSGENKERFYPSEIQEYFNRIVNELNLVLPSPLEAARILTCYWSRCILVGEVCPQEGVRHIAEEAYFRLPNKENQKFVGDCISIEKLMGAFYEYDDLIESGETAPEYFDELDQEVKKEAQKYLEIFDTGDRKLL